MSEKAITEKTETARLRRLFKALPENKKKAAEGLIVQAARLRVQLNELWADIDANGNTEEFTQSPDAPAYDRERPATRIYAAANKNYLAIMKQLIDIVPEGGGKSKLAELMRDG